MQKTFGIKKKKKKKKKINTLSEPHACMHGWKE
jgi:hypothetical protein